MIKVTIHRINQAGARWMVSAYIGGGRRIRHRFKDEAKARAMLRELQEKFHYEGSEGYLFTAAARADYVAAVNELAELGSNLRDAVAFYAAHHGSGPAVAFAEAVGALLDAKRAANRSPRTTHALGVHLRAFGFHGAIKTVADVTPEKVRAFVTRRNLRPRSVLALRTSLLTFCRFCRQRGWMKSDPVAGIERPVIDAVRVTALRPEQCAKLLTAATVVEGGRCVRAVALLMLAGLRVSEVFTLREEDIRQTSIRVADGKTRGRRAVRVVPISPVLGAWLDLYPDAPLKPVNWTQLWRKIRRRAGVRVLQDGLRKTWISYRLAETKDERQVAREAGNSPDIIYRHYYDLIDPVDVPRFGAFSWWPRP